MNRKVVLFSICVLLILAASNVQRIRLDSSKDALHPAKIDGRELGVVPPVAETIPFFQERIKANPQDAISYTLLAEQYIRQARERGDAASYQRAQAALQEAIQRLPDYAPAKVQLATVYYARHEFLSALKLAQKTYEEDPQVTEALAIIGDAQMALGNYSEAALAYEELQSRQNSPGVLARLAAFEELQGHPQEALDLMRRAAQDALQAGGSRESVAWYVLRVGDLYYNMGQVEQARRYYEAALRVFEKYHLALAGLGKVSAAQANVEQAVRYYQQAIDIVPQPEYLAALGDLYMIADQPARAESQYRTIEQIGKLAQLQQQIYNRQLARFYADHDTHLDEALRLALAELDFRRDIYGYDTAAWAYYKNSDLTQAQAMMEQAMKMGTRDAQLYYHAGMIALKLGEEGQARDYLEEALSINPHFSILDAQKAREALEELRQRFAERADEDL